MEYMYDLLTLLLMIIKMRRISKKGYWCKWTWGTIFCLIRLYHLIQTFENNPILLSWMTYRQVCINVTRVRQQMPLVEQGQPILPEYKAINRIRVVHFFFFFCEVWCRSLFSFCHFSFNYYLVFIVQKLWINRVEGVIRRKYRQCNGQRENM